MEIYKLAKFLAKFLSLSLEFSDFYLPPTLSWNLFTEETFALLASMVAPQVDEHHVSSRIRKFKVNLWIRRTLRSRFKIYNDLYSCPQDLWPVAGPLEFEWLKVLANDIQQRL